jgi:predicted nucleotidyltransferase
MGQLQIEIPIEYVRDFCRKWKVVEFAVFGSVLRPDFAPDSDVDVLLTFQDDSEWSLFDRVDMQDDLETIFGRKVQVVNRKGVEKSGNLVRRQAILESAQVIHAA